LNPIEEQEHSLREQGSPPVGHSGLPATPSIPPAGQGVSAAEQQGSPLQEWDTPDKGDATRKRGKRRLFHEIVEVLLIVVVAVIVTTLLRTFVIDNYEIPTGSMEPTIEIGDRLFAEKVSYHFGSPAHGDIVTFHDPTMRGAGSTSARVLIKRCIATGGQTVDLINGRVAVDGIVLNEPYVNGRESVPLTPMAEISIEYPYVVPEGSIWVMGDNRTDSSDSRYFGPVSQEELIGKALFRIWPLERFGPISP
jgi:signal peptidase I